MKLTFKFIQEIYARSGPVSTERRGKWGFYSLDREATGKACPFFPGAKNRLHWSFRDPSRATGGEEERSGVFREVRDELVVRIEKELVLVGEESLTS